MCIFLSYNLVSEEVTKIYLDFFHFPGFHTALDIKD